MRGRSAFVLTLMLVLACPAAQAEAVPDAGAAGGETEVTVRMLDSERAVTPGGLPTTGERDLSLPEGILVAGGCAAVLVGVTWRRRRRDD